MINIPWYLFIQTGAIFGPQMSDVLSGGIVYEFTEEENGYGLVSIEGNKVTKLEDFYNLKEQLSKIDPKVCSCPVVILCL
jgi:hypothetical protein